MTKRILRPNMATVTGRMQMLGNKRKRLPISGNQVAPGVVIEAKTPACTYQLTRMNVKEWVILGSARFRTPTICIPHDGFIEQGKALSMETSDGQEVRTAVITDVRVLPKSADLAGQLIEAARTEAEDGF